MKTPRHTADGAAPARTRTFLPRLTLVLVALAFAVFAASALAGSDAAKGAFVINDSIPPSSQGQVLTHVWYTQNRALCDEFVTNSRIDATLHYKVYTFQLLSGGWSGGNPQQGNTCVNVSLLVHSGSASAALYYAPFLPNDLTPNRFVGSVGGLGGPPFTTAQAGDFARRIYAGTPPDSFDIVVYETMANGGASYTLLVEGTGLIMTSSGTPTAADGLQSFRASSASMGVLVRWKTRSEQNALGFNLYRGDAKKVRLTRSMVRASGNGRGHTYSYIDRSARKGKAAPYYLEVVQRGGARIMFGPALRTAR